ncbi:MAG: sulfate/thiosulfate ABC transporter permease CysW, partial [Gammaproteobacteria bacterium]
MRGALSPAVAEPRLVRWLLIGAALAFVGVSLVLPLLLVLTQAFADGLASYWAALKEPDAVAALKLTLTAAAIAVPANLVFGLAAAWTIAKFEFKGKQLLLTFID